MSSATTLRTADNSDVQNLTDVVKHLPKDIFKVRLTRAFLGFFQAVLLSAASSYWVYVAPWYLLPLAWIVAGTCWVGLFVIGHDCAHQSFSNSSLLNEIVGTIVFSWLGWPYNAWLYTHNHHHAYTNNLKKDHLWKPLDKKTQEKLGPLGKWFLYLFYVGPLFFEASILHHLMHFNVLMFKPAQRLKVLRSVIITLAVNVASFYWLYNDPNTSIFSFWVMPFLVFNFWLSTYTYFHHRSKHVPWIEAENWNKARAQLFHTVHLDYHPVIEFLHFDINWHIPHHVSTSIPWYNLRRATYALMTKYGDRLHIDEMGWQYWKETVEVCHVHDQAENYVPIWGSKTATKSKGE